MVRALRVVFMGSGELACPALRRLATGPEAEVVAAIAQPDRPQGRRLRRAPCPGRAEAERLGLPVRTPLRIGDAAEALRALAPDLLVVAAYGQFLPAAVLAIPTRGAINLHPSLLPRYRGAAPIPWAIAHGDRETGVTVQFMTQRMDAGDIILQERVAIGEDETAAQLAARLAELGAELMARAVALFAAGEVPRRPQDEAQVVMAPKLHKEDGWVDWGLPAAAIRNRIRAFQPWPGSFTEAPAGSGRRLRLLEAAIESGHGAAGEVLATDGDGPLVAAGEAALRLRRVQPEGGRAMSGRAWVCGHEVRPGLRFGGSPPVSRHGGPGDGRTGTGQPGTSRKAGE